jgi:hypothetical protein
MKTCQRTPKEVCAEGMWAGGRAQDAPSPAHSNNGRANSAQACVWCMRSSDRFSTAHHACVPRRVSRRILPPACARSTRRCQQPGARAAPLLLLLQHKTSVPGLAGLARGTHTTGPTAQPARSPHRVRKYRNGAMHASLDPGCLCCSCICCHHSDTPLPAARDQAWRPTHVSTQGAVGALASLRRRCSATCVCTPYTPPFDDDCVVSAASRARARTPAHLACGAGRALAHEGVSRCHTQARTPTPTPTPTPTHTHTQHLRHTTCGTALRAPRTTHHAAHGDDTGGGHGCRTAFTHAGACNTTCAIRPDHMHGCTWHPSTPRTSGTLPAHTTPLACVPPRIAPPPHGAAAHGQQSAPPTHVTRPARHQPCVGLTAACSN